MVSLPDAFPSAEPSRRKKSARLKEGRESSLFVGSVEKAFQVLDAFDSNQSSLTLSQIAAKAKLDLSSTQRATHTLVTLRYLRKDAETRKFSLAPRLLDYSYRYLASNELAGRAFPYIQQLAQEADETTNLTILDDTEIVYIIRIASRFVLAPNVIVGTRIPAFCAAPGLAILAHLPREQVEDIYERTDFSDQIYSVPIDHDAMFERLAKARQLGYVRADGEFYKGDVSTAAAILDSNDVPVGAINISVQKRRWDPVRDDQRIRDLILTAAAAISGRPR